MIEIHRLFFVCLLCVLGVFFCLWQRSQCFKLSRRLLEQEERLKKIKNIERELLIRLSALSSWERIEKIAKNQLGLVFGSGIKSSYRRKIFKKTCKKDKNVKKDSVAFEKNNLSFSKVAIMKKDLDCLESFSKPGVHFQELFGPRFLQFADASRGRSSQIKKKV